MKTQRSWTWPQIGQVTEIRQVLLALGVAHAVKNAPRQGRRSLGQFQVSRTVAAEQLLPALPAPRLAMPLVAHPAPASTPALPAERSRHPIGGRANTRRHDSLIARPILGGTPKLPLWSAQRPQWRAVDSEPTRVQARRDSLTNAGSAPRARTMRSLATLQRPTGHNRVICVAHALGLSHYRRAHSRQV